MKQSAILVGAIASLTIVLGSMAHADYSIPLKANPVLCSGANEKTADSKVSLKVVTTDEKGLYTIEYLIDNQAVVRLESKYPLRLSYEGSLYIQTYDETGKATLTVADGDISNLNKDMTNSGPLSKLAYNLVGRFQAGDEAFQVSCMGAFVK